MRRNSDIAIRFITLCSTHLYTSYFNEIFTTCNKVDIIWKLFSQWLHWYKSQLHTTYLDWDTGCQLAMTKSLYSTIIFQTPLADSELIQTLTLSSVEFEKALKWSKTPVCSPRFFKDF